MSRVNIDLSNLFPDYQGEVDHIYYHKAVMNGTYKGRKIVQTGNKSNLSLSRKLLRGVNGTPTKTP